MVTDSTSITSLNPCNSSDSGVKQIKALKKFIAVSGFTKSVLQCDGHSGLLALQEQVGRDMSLPTQVSPPHTIRVRELWREFTKLSIVKSEPSG